MLLLTFFYVAGSILSFSAALFFVREPVVSIIFLIIVFLCSAINMIIIQASFFAMIMTIIYVGAITILFLFVIMMLPEHHIKKSSWSLKLKKPKRLLSYKGYLYLLKILALWILACLPFYIPTLMHVFLIKKENAIVSNARGINAIDIGTVFYLEYAVVFQMGGVLLLIAMIGSIMLCMRENSVVTVRRQSVFEQIGRNKSVVLHSLAPGEGIVKNQED